jgi:hypothetical protein
MLRVKKRQVRFAILAFASALLALSAARPTRAQSADVNFPTPVFDAEVSGRIAARDIGDARRTHHFYTFRGTEGDVTVTVEASELIGDVDVFTASTLRPLIKFTLFGDATRVTKSFYVRSEETLVLRVEARASGDREGTYRVTFGGSFAPAPASLANVEEPKTPTLSESTRGPGTRRVTSAGARIEEPKPEPTPTPVEEATAPEPHPTPAPTRSTTRRGARSTRSSSRARTTPAPRPKPTNTETADANAPANGTADANSDANAETPATEPKPAATPARSTPRRRNTRGSRGRASTDRPAADAQPSGGAEPATPAPAAATGRLVIITLDGEIFEREMNTVRSVTVEKGQLVVTTLDGKTTRRPMSNVLRMSIEP